MTGELPAARPATTAQRWKPTSLSFRGAHVSAQLRIHSNTKDEFRCTRAAGLERGFFENLRHDTAPAATVDAPTLVRRTIPAMVAGRNAHTQHLTADMGGEVASRDVVPSHPPPLLRSSSGSAAKGVGSSKQATFVVPRKTHRTVDGCFSRPAHEPPAVAPPPPPPLENVHFKAGGEPSLRLGMHHPHITDYAPLQRSKKPSPPRRGDLQLREQQLKTSSSPRHATDRTGANQIGAHVSAGGPHEKGPRLPRPDRSRERVASPPSRSAYRPQFSNTNPVGEYRPNTAEQSIEPYQDGVTTAVRAIIPRYLQLGLGQSTASPPIQVSWMPLH